MSMSGIVLIVDDSLTVRMDLAEGFEAAGLWPLLCASIREAREALTAEAVDLVILNTRFPHRNAISVISSRRTLRRSSLSVEHPLFRLCTRGPGRLPRLLAITSYHRPYPTKDRVARRWRIESQRRTLP